MGSSANIASEGRRCQAFPVFSRPETNHFCSQVGISVNLIFLVVGLVVSSAVPPLAFMLTWSKVPRGAAITSALVGQAAGIIAWLVHTQVVYGSITQDTSQVRSLLEGRACREGGLTLL